MKASSLHPMLKHDQVMQWYKLWCELIVVLVQIPKKFSIFWVKIFVLHDMQI